MGPRKLPVKQCNGLKTRTVSKSEVHDRSPLPAVAGSPDENHWVGAVNMPMSATSPLRSAFRYFPPASPASEPGPGKQKKTPKDSSQLLICLRKIGAGEGIRTLDPDLGKVVLYP